MPWEHSSGKALLPVLIAVLVLGWPLDSDEAYEAPAGQPPSDLSADVKPATRRSEGRLTPVAMPAPSQVEENAEPAYPVLHVIADVVNVREGPSTDYRVIGRAHSGDRALEFGRSGGWVRLRLEEHGVDGWISGRYLERSRLAAGSDPAEVLSDDAIRREFIRESIVRYPGSCPCPFNLDRAGRRCGERSAHSRPGRASLLCYPADVPASAITAYRQILAR